MTASPNGEIALYDTRNNSFRRDAVYRAGDVGWAIVDTAYSSDQKSIIFSSWSPFVTMIDLETSQPHSLNFHHDGMCPFSIAFSHDSKEIIAG